MSSTEFAVIGAGPAGLAAAHDLARRGRSPVVFEADQHVGGLAKTVERRGFRFDIGPHRFFTKSPEVEALWSEMLPAEEFPKVPRTTRIWYRGKLFNYPLKPMNALFGLGPFTSARVMASFLWRKVFPVRPEKTFEDWVANRFGHALFAIFFKTYTEKVLGMSCTEISADWAAQRIRNLNLGRAVLDALGFGRRGGVASLVDEFNYPRRGAGQMYEAMAARAESMGAEIRTGTPVERVKCEGGRVVALGLADEAGDDEPVEGVLSTMPLTELVQRLEPEAPPEVADAARALRYRSILNVNVILGRTEIPPDNWIYLHSPEIRAGRVQLYKNWSPQMVPDPGMSSMGFEYFCFEGDEVWTKSEDELVELARADLGRLGFADPGAVEDGFVVRYPNAYPIYEGDYRGRLSAIREHLAKIENLVCCGRYGQFRYNNMDHSIMTALLGVRRLLGEDVDPWSVNEEAEYHEEGASSEAG